MLKQIAENVLVQESSFISSNTVVVQGRAGMLLIDPGIRDEEMVGLANGLTDLGEAVIAGFSTHPHWDHLLWHSRFGTVPRYCTASAARAVGALRSDSNWMARIAEWIPPDVVDQVPLELCGIVTGLPPETPRIPWVGPAVRIIEHRAHAAGHAALLIEGSGVLVAGDMLSDVLPPMLDLHGAADPVGDYLAALELLASVASDVDVVVPGHGSIGGPEQLRERIDQDRAYVEALRDGGVHSDPRFEAGASGQDWLIELHERQRDGVAKAYDNETALEKS